MTCLALALTAQLICLSDHTLVCTDNGSVAQLLNIPTCNRIERNPPNDNQGRTAVLDRPANNEGVLILDLARDGRE
jgi:hypothetical protein